MTTSSESKWKRRITTSNSGPSVDITIRTSATTSESPQTPQEGSKAVRDANSNRKSTEQSKTRQDTNRRSSDSSKKNKKDPASSVKSTPLGKRRWCQNEDHERRKVQNSCSDSSPLISTSQNSVKSKKKKQNGESGKENNSSNSQKSCCSESVRQSGASSRTEKIATKKRSKKKPREVSQPADSDENDDDFEMPTRSDYGHNTDNSTDSDEDNTGADEDSDASVEMVATDTTAEESEEEVDGSSVSDGHCATRTSSPATSIDSQRQRIVPVMTKEATAYTESVIKREKGLEKTIEVCIKIITLFGPSEAQVRVLIDDCVKNNRIEKEARRQLGDCAIDRAKEGFESANSGFARYLRGIGEKKPMPVRKRAKSRCDDGEQSEPTPGKRASKNRRVSK